MIAEAWTRRVFRPTNRATFAHLPVRPIVRSGKLASPIRSIRRPWPRLAIALCWLCHGRATWNLSSPILSQVIQDDGFACSWICLDDPASFGAGKEYETT